MGIQCHHRYAEKLHNARRKKITTICRYRDDPSKCELFRSWEEEIKALNSKNKRGGKKNESRRKSKVRLRGRI